MTRARFVGRVGAFAAMGGALAIIACTTAATTTTPITGITILADTVTTGHGCGPGDAEVYKYAAVTWNSYYASPAVAFDDAGVLAFGNVFDCYTDGFFPNLAGAPDGSVSYNVDIGAFNAATINSGPLANLDIWSGTAPELESILGTAQYRWSCTATQQLDVQVLAACHPTE